MASSGSVPHFIYEPSHEKTNNLNRQKTKTQINLNRQKTKTQITFAVTAKLISAFVFASRKVQSLFSNPKIQASSHLLCSYSLVFVRPYQKSHCWCLAYLSRRLTGELIGWPSSVVRRCSRRRRRCLQCSNVFSSETTGPIKAKLHVAQP